MAKKIEGSKWVTQHNYLDKRVKRKEAMKKNPELYGKTKEMYAKLTVPGQTQSVKEMLERHKKGRPQPQE